MNDLQTQTLAQIVNATPRAANVFEKYHLDFCCKGKRSLKAACDEMNLPLQTVLQDLERNNSMATPSNKDYSSYTLSQLVDHIVATHHAYVKQESAPLLAYLEKIAAKHGERHPEMRLVRTLFAEIKREMEEHMQKEELILFPRIKEVEQAESEAALVSLTSGYVLAPIRMMEAEHDQAGTILAEIRRLTRNFQLPSDACTTYKLSFAMLEAFELDLHQHVHLENNILFPKALALFATPSQSILN